MVRRNDKRFIQNFNAEQSPLCCYEPEGGKIMQPYEKQVRYNK
ncbi:MAG: hypothetical protein QXV69_07890 [Sulfolobaceae archaeon]